MGSVTKFAAVNTKVKALERYLLKDGDYHAMLNAQNEREVIAYLNEKTYYGELIEQVGSDHLQIDQLEALVRQFVFGRYQKLVHYFTNEHRKLFKMLFMRYEVENLKLLLRAIYRNESIERVTNELMISTMFSKINYEGLGRSTSLDNFVENLKGTPYYRILKPYVHENSKRLMFYMEMNLDRIYFKMLGDQIYKLEGDDRELMLELLGRNTDILNIQWIYRGLKFYGVSPEELFNYCLGNGYISINKLKELCYSSSEEDLVQILKDSKYGFLFEQLETVDQLMELNMERYLYKVLISLEKKSQMNIMPSVIFMHKLEYEMRDIFTILETKRYRMGVDDIKNYLVREL